MRDTSRHYCECPCEHCVANHTGLLLMRDLLARHRTRVISDAIMAIYITTARQNVERRMQEHARQKAA